MDRSRAATARKQRVMMAPAPEVLEARRLLAANAGMVTISEGQSQGTPTLLILGTNKSDVIHITDNGSGQAGNVTVTLGNGGVYTSKSGIQEIEVMGLAGNDQITYTLTGTLVAAQTVLVDLGSGTDTYTANVNGAVDNLAGLDLETYGGSGTDTMTINQTGEIMEGTFIPFMQGGRGKAIITYNGTGSIDANAVINPAIAAGSGDNTIVSNYSGTIDGIYAYNMSIKGGRGKADITDNINVGPYSMGAVGTSTSAPALIKLGSGKSHVKYAVNVDPTASQAQIYAAVTGGTNRDFIERTANVVEDSNIKGDYVITGSSSSSSSS
jgi:hypothetical protein